jgi:phosphoribosylamine--glycine ligase
MSKVLVVGSGGREHALAWKLQQSLAVEAVFVAPGNGGTSKHYTNVPIAADDIPALVDFARQQQIDLTVIGPDNALANGIVDAFQHAGLTVFGPTKAAAQIEASKAFAKDMMNAQHVPTASYQTFTDFAAATEYIQSCAYPLVVKASGLALGKGVVICANTAEAETALTSIMQEKEFGTAGNQVVIESFLEGQEVSFHALSDGERYVLFPPSQDHKQIFDGDKGPNTGGMGVIAPVPWVTTEQIDTVKHEVVQPILTGLAQASTPFKGCLYPGAIMTSEGPKVLEYNARFGDPETQVYMRLLTADLYALLLACVEGKLNEQSVGWHSGAAVCVVVASEGYPGAYKKGLPIAGLEAAEQVEGVIVFHAGTAIKEGELVTAGGRVLNITAVGEDISQALERAYKAVDCIHFSGMQYRRDIGRRNLSVRDE